MNYVSTVAAPITVEGSLWGVMTVSDQRKPLPPDTEERVAKFTELVGTAIAEGESRSHLEQLASEQAALRRVATLVAEDVPSSELFGAVAREVGTLFGADFTPLIRYESDPSFATTLMAFWAAAGEHPRPPSRPRTVPGDLTSMIADSRKPMRVDDWTDVPGPIAEFARDQLKVRSSVGCPIVVEGRLWGALGVHSKRGPFPRDTETRLLNFCELVATAIANRNAHDEISRLAAEQAALRRVATLVAQGVSPEEVFSVVSSEVGRLFGSDQAAVARYDPDGSGMVYVGVSPGARGVSIGTRWPLEEYLSSTTVYRTGRSARMDRSDFETASGPLADSLRAMNLVSRVAAPIVVEGELWGVITVGGTREPLASRYGATRGEIHRAGGDCDRECREPRRTCGLAREGDRGRRRGTATHRARPSRRSTTTPGHPLDRPAHDAGNHAGWVRQTTRRGRADRRRSGRGRSGAPRALTRDPSSRPHARWACPRAQSTTASLPSSRHARHTLREPAPGPGRGGRLLHGLRDPY